jgi:hypothetical protein
MRRFLLAIILACVGFVMPAHAQSLSILSGGCGTGSYVNGVPYLTINSVGELCILGTFSQSTPNVASTGTAPLSVSTSSSRTALGDTSGGYATLIISNDGSTGFYFNLGNSSVTATTSNSYLAPGRAVEVAQGSATNVAAITGSSTSTLSVTQLSGPTNIAGGGSGSGGGSSGAVYGPTAAGSAAANPPVLMGGTQNGGATGTVQNAEIDSSGNLHVGAPSGAFVDGSIATLGTEADAPCTVPTTTTACTLAALTKALINVADSPILLPVNISPTDCSVALTTGGTAQNIISASATIHGFTIANIDASAGSGEPVWISFTTTAAASTIGSYPLAAPTASTFVGLNSYTTPTGFASNHAVSVIAVTTGHKISCTYW